jgi:hypothetical protein
MGLRRTAAFYRMFRLLGRRQPVRRPHYACDTLPIHRRPIDVSIIEVLEADTPGLQLPIVVEWPRSSS